MASPPHSTSHTPPSRNDPPGDTSNDIAFQSIESNDPSQEEDMDLNQEAHETPAEDQSARDEAPTHHTSTALIGPIRRVERQDPETESREQRRARMIQELLTLEEWPLAHPRDPPGELPRLHLDPAPYDLTLFRRSALSLPWTDLEDTEDLDSESEPASLRPYGRFGGGPEWCTWLSTEEEIQDEEDEEDRQEILEMAMECYGINAEKLDWTISGIVFARPGAEPAKRARGMLRYERGDMIEMRTRKQ